MPPDDTRERETLHEVSVVVPVYQGERTLEALADEIVPLTLSRTTPGGRRFRVAELVLVHDGAADGSAEVMKALGARHPFVRLGRPSPNYGQPPATLAGMASTGAGWVGSLGQGGQ